MTLSEIAVLALLSAAIGRWVPPAQRLPLLLALTVGMLFWLQASLLFALLSLLLVLAVWWVVGQEERGLPWGGILVGMGAGLLLLLWQGLPPLPGLLALGLVAAISAGSVARLERAAPALRHALAGLLILLIVGLLFFLKSPALTSFASTFSAGHYQQAVDWQWLGISYLSFRLMAMLLDFRAGRLPPYNLRDTLIYALFPPALAAGPIDRAQRFMPDLLNLPRLDTERFVWGSRRLASGLFRKFVLANSLALVALSPQLAADTDSMLGAWLLTYLYAAYIFLDFSGYTDIAIGLGIWLGLKLPENFQRPYLQATLPLFWQNWHMTLTAWFRSYVFLPFSRALLRRKLPISEILLSQVLTMSLIGFWHGVEGHFLLWGLWHALGIYAHHLWTKYTRRRLLRLREQRPRLHRAWQGFSVLLTFHFVALGWVFFALPQPFDFLLKLLGVGV